MIQGVIKIILGVMLFICAIKDIKSKEISLFVIILSFFVIVVTIILKNEISILSRFGGVLVGLFLIIISKITRGQIGMGDGLVFCVTGMGLGIWDNMYLLFYSLFISAIFAGIVLITNRMDRRKVIPFVPFILVGYLGILLL